LGDSVEKKSRKNEKQKAGVERRGSLKLKEVGTFWGSKRASAFGCHGAEEWTE
jgi:hypothetical protein